jgi:uncharacterized protein (DUF1499 family)
MRRLPVIAFGIALVAIALLAAAGPVYRMGAALPTAFGLLRYAAYAGAAAALVALIAGGVSYSRGARMGLTLSIVALIAALTALAVPYSWQRRAQSLPRIHDISTDLENPPQFEAVVPLRKDAPNSLERPPVIAEQQRKGYPDLQPLTLSVPRDQAFDRALAVAQEKGWEIVTADKASGRIEATDTTRWFGFKDDVVIRLTPWGAGTRVDVRSVSRVGLSDIGTNARRIEDFLDSLAS